jgi:hypothetical protein
MRIKHRIAFMSYLLDSFACAAILEVSYDAKGIKSIKN